MKPAALATVAAFLSACGGDPAPGAHAPIANDPRAACTADTARVLQSLKEPIVVTAYVTRSGRPLKAIGETIDLVFARLRQAAPGKITYKNLDPALPGLEAEAKEAGLSEQVFADKIDEKTATMTKGFAGIGFRYRGETEAMPVVTKMPAADLDYWIATKIRELRARGDKLRFRIGVVSGKEEAKLTDPDLVAQTTNGKPPPSLAGVMQTALPYFELAPIDLGGGRAEIDPSLFALIVTQPGADYSDAELAAIDRFVMRGNKSLFVAAGAVNLRPHQGLSGATLSTHRLERLLAGYGIEMKSEALFDPGGAAEVKVKVADREPVTVSLPAIVHAELDTSPVGQRRLDPSFAGFFRLSELTFPFASPLVAHPEKQPGATMRMVARTTNSAIGSVDAPIDFMPNAPPPRGTRGARAIAIAVEGRLTSAFGAKTSEAPSRVLVVSSSEFLSNPFARQATEGDADMASISQFYAQQNVVATILAFKNTLDWMTQDNAVCAAGIEGRD